MKSIRKYPIFYRRKDDGQIFVLYVKNGFVYKFFKGGMVKETFILTERRIKRFIREKSFERVREEEVVFLL